MSPLKQTYSCAKCFRAIAGGYSIGCHGCGGWFHKGDCSGLSAAAMNKIALEQRASGYKWRCLLCIKSNTKPDKLTQDSTVVLADDTNLSIQMNENVKVITENGNAYIDLVKYKMQMTIDSLTDQNKLLMQISKEKDEKYELLEVILTEKDEKYKLLEENKQLLLESLLNFKSEIKRLKNEQHQLTSKTVSCASNKSQKKIKQLRKMDIPISAHPIESVSGVAVESPVINNTTKNISDISTRTLTSDKNDIDMDGDDIVLKVAYIEM